jgi:hypothetical protein
VRTTEIDPRGWCRVQALSLLKVTLFRKAKTPLARIIHSEPSKGWLLHVHPQGWIYFSNPSLKIVTDQASYLCMVWHPSHIKWKKDIRLPEIYEILDEATKLPFNNADDSEGIEMHLQVTKELSANNVADGRGVLSLAINHLHCVASYEYEDVKQFETPQTDMRTCEDIILSSPRRTFHTAASESVAAPLLELVVESSFSRRSSFESPPGSQRCSYLVHCTSHEEVFLLYVIGMSDR